jgi:3-dehydroquinate synthase
MKEIKIGTARPYSVKIGAGLLDEAGHELSGILRAPRLALVSGEIVYPLYGERLRRSLVDAGFQVSVYLHPDGEAAKSLECYGELLGFLSENGFTRQDAILAFGGGVTGDLAGFAAATYQRGMDYVQIPSTLLAMVDSSVGGKTGLNLPGGKNQAGCFYQPRLVLCDPELLSTLPREQLRSGAGEVIKYALLRDPGLFDTLRRGLILPQAGEIIERCLRIKQEYVSADERDLGLRHFLNLGHTFGHAIEACAAYHIPHGCAVAAGMAMITRAAARKGICAEDTPHALSELLLQFGLPVVSEYTASQLMDAIRMDKKRAGDTLTLVVPEEIGRCRLLPVPLAEVPDWLRLAEIR